MAFDERLIFVFILEERGQGRHALLVLHTAFKAFDELFIAHQLAVLGIQRRADRDGEKTVFGENSVLFIELQGLDKALAQPLAVVERAAEEHDLALDFTSLRQSADSLIDDRLIDGGGDVGFGRALVDQRLDIRFREYAAARGDGVEVPVGQAQLIHLGIGEV